MSDSIFDHPDYSPLRDMTCQPAVCEECGASYRRLGAYLICSNGHNRSIECVGIEDHPRHAEWERYIDTNGREAWERAVDRCVQRSIHHGYWA
jgi:hypothetical protein